MPVRWKRSSPQQFPLENAQAFSQFYERSHLILFRYIFGLHGGPQEDVEDLAAEAFIRAWRARRRFQGSERAALGWLLHIARNLVIDTHRRRKTRGEPDSIDNVVVCAPDATPEEQTAIHEQSRVLWAVLQTLPAEKREMLVLRYMLGWRVKDIAQHLGMTENTVSVNIRRILARLRRDWPAE